MKLIDKSYPRILPIPEIEWESTGYFQTVRRWGPITIIKFYETLWSPSLRASDAILLEKTITLF